MRVFAPEWTVKALSWIGWEEGQPIYHKRISKGIARAQKKVEERNFEIRKSLLEYDEVMDYQRKRGDGLPTKDFLFAQAKDTGREGAQRYHR
jgi:preprotein translocase subunit SecA